MNGCTESRQRLQICFWRDIQYFLLEKRGNYLDNESTFEYHFKLFLCPWMLDIGV